MTEDNVLDYIELLRQDLVEQFRGKPALDALIRVIGRQLNDVYRFFCQLRDERSLFTAYGKQLDGIGDIVVLDRAQAGELACITEPSYVLDDEPYRDYLLYKIWRNTNTTTYWDIIKGLRMFWERPIYYAEDPEIPACMIFDTGDMEGFVDTRKLILSPLIRAAGVGFRIQAKTVVEMAPCVITIISGFMTRSEDTLPWTDREIDWFSSVHYFNGSPSVDVSILPEPELMEPFSQSSIMETPMGEAVWQS